MYCADIEWKRLVKSMVRESSDRDDDDGFIVVYFGSERRGRVEGSGGRDSGRSRKRIEGGAEVSEETGSFARKELV
jgi:hypothetical protein